MKTKTSIEEQGKIIHLFKTLKDNRLTEIQKVVGFSVPTISRVIDNYYYKKK